MGSFWRQGRLWHFWKRELEYDQHSKATHLDWDWPGRIAWKLGDNMFTSKKQIITLITWPAERGKIQECDALGWTTPPPRIRKENLVPTPEKIISNINSYHLIKVQWCEKSNYAHLSVWDGSNTHSISGSCHQQWNDKRCLENPRYTLSMQCPLFDEKCFFEIFSSIFSGCSLNFKL